MKLWIHILLLSLGVCLSGCARHTDRATAPLPELIFHKPTKAITEERLELKVVSTKQNRGRFTHEIFLGKQKFGSLEAVIVALGKLPKGTEVYYDYSCLGVPNRPLNHHEELVAFQQRCEKIGIILVLEYATQPGRVKRMVRGKMTGEVFKRGEIMIADSFDLKSFQESVGGLEYGTEFPPSQMVITRLEGGVRKEYRIHFKEMAQYHKKGFRFMEGDEVYVPRIVF